MSLRGSKVIELYVEKLIKYGRAKDFFDDEDTIYIRNQILKILEYHDYKELSEEVHLDQCIEEVLDEILKWAAKKDIIEENTTLYRDILDSALMGAMLARPSEIINIFNEEYKQSPERATEYLYNLSIDSNYIRKSRTDKNIKWKYQSIYGNLEMTINVSKPEKDVKEIEAERNTPKTNYPRCLLCAENEGYGGRINHPGRQNLRIIPLKLGDEQWYLQYSPYLYYNEHCILLNRVHTPMVINRNTLVKMMDFINIFPHYFIGSNADLPVVGGSILSHDHFQGGRHQFPMEMAKEIRRFNIPQFKDVRGSILKWPLSVVRLKSKDKEKLIELGDQIIKEWRGYKDEVVGIIPFSQNEPHNTITPIARKEEGFYVLDLVLRNNRRDDNHPLGIFHPHQEVHNVKKENIGLIEVMGLAVLPPRLFIETKLVERYLLKCDLSQEERGTIEKHMNLCKEILYENRVINKGNVEDIVKKAIGEKFVLALKHAGVFKEDEKGQDSFGKFLKTLGWIEIYENI